MKLENFKLSQEDVYQVPGFISSDSFQSAPTTNSTTNTSNVAKTELDYFLLLKRFFAAPTSTREEVSNALMLKEAKDFFILFLRFFDEVKQYWPSKKTIPKDHPDNETTLNFSSHKCDQYIDHRYDVIYNSIFSSLQKLKNPKVLIMDNNHLDNFNKCVISLFPNTSIVTTEPVPVDNLNYVRTSSFARASIESIIDTLPSKTFNFININGNCTLTKMLDILYISMTLLDNRGHIVIANAYDPHNIWNCFAHILRSTGTYNVDIYDGNSPLILIEKIGPLKF
jgi:hypothetical protein